MKRLSTMSFDELIIYEKQLCDKGKIKDAEKVRREITDRMAEKRKAEGTDSWLMYAGYTGRNKNRR